MSDYGPVDLLIALNVLHSPSLRGHEIFKSWVKGLLSPSSSVLVGLPNCRYYGYEARYGASVSKHGGSINDMSQLLSEVDFIRGIFANRALLFGSPVSEQSMSSGDEKNKKGAHFFHSNIPEETS